MVRGLAHGEPGVRGHPDGSDMSPQGSSSRREESQPARLVLCFSFSKKIRHVRGGRFMPRWGGPPISHASHPPRKMTTCVISLAKSKADDSNGRVLKLRRMSMAGRHIDQERQCQTDKVSRYREPLPPPRRKQGRGPIPLLSCSNLNREQPASPPPRCYARGTPPGGTGWPEDRHRTPPH